MIDGTLILLTETANTHTQHTFLFGRDHLFSSHPFLSGIIREECSLVWREGGVGHTPTITLHQCLGGGARRYIIGIELYQLLAGCARVTHKHAFRDVPTMV